VREKRLLTEEQTVRVLARLDDPHLLICETCLDTGTRISEVTALTMATVDLEMGSIRILRRNWRGDIDEPKTAKSKRTLALGRTDRTLSDSDRQSGESRRRGLGVSAGRGQGPADVGLGRP